MRVYATLPPSPLELQLPPIFQHPKLTQVMPQLKLYLGGASLLLQDP